MRGTKMRTVLTDTSDHALPDGPGLWTTAADAERITGWVLKPEGMCRDELCVPLPAAAKRDGQIDLAAFWTLLGAPVVSDATGSVWSLGTSADERSDRLASLEAPDFTLSDLAGVPHTLSALRGKKVFLTTWASW
jgi:hypothetical protein